MAPKKGASKKVSQPDLTSTHALLYETVSTIKEDIDKFVEGNNAAGSRIRKAMQDAKKLAQQIRVDVMTIRHSR